MKKIQYNSSSKLLNNIIAKVNLIIDKLVVDVKVNGTSVVVVNENGEREADIDLSLADQNVKQSPTTSSDNSDHPILLSKSANTTEETDGVYKDGGLYYNPYDEKLTAPNVSFSTAFIAYATVTSLITSQYYFNLGSGNAVAMLEANSASTASNPTFVTLPASSGTLALKSELPTNPVLWSENNVLGAKNLLNISGAERNNLGVNSTLNQDGSVTVNGTATGQGQMFVYNYCEFPKLNLGDKIIFSFEVLSGSYTHGSSSSLSRIYLVGLDNNTLQNKVCEMGASLSVGNKVFVTYEIDSHCFENGICKINGVQGYFRSGDVFSNLKLGIMVRLESVADDTFEPFAQTNRQLTINKMDWNNYTEYGVKNLIPYPWEHKNGRVNRGITFGCSGEGYVTFNGTASTTQEPFFSYTGTSSTSVANGTYLKISGNKRYRIAIERTDDRLWAIAYVRNLDGTDTSNLNIFVEFEDGSTAIKGSNVNTRDSGISHKSLYFIIPNNNEYYIQVDIRCSANTGSYSSSTAKGRVILQPYEISDLSWMPYAKSNYELTTLKAEYKQISTVELTDSASRAYTKNELMIWRGDLHRVTQAITSGGSITLNTNVVATTLSAEIKAIRDALNI